MTKHMLNLVLYDIGGTRNSY